MLRLSRFVLRHKLAVVLCWLVVLVAGAGAAAVVPDRLVIDFSFPDAEGYKANVAVLEAYGNGGPGNPLVPVVTLPEGTTVDDPDARAALERAFAGLAGDPRLRVLSYPDTEDRGLVSADGRTTFALVFQPYIPGVDEEDVARLPPEARTALRDALPPGSTVEVTGLDRLAALAEGEGSEGEGDTGVLSETVLGGLGALVVLAFVFGSFLALVPLLIAAVSILGTFLAVLGLTEITEMNFVVQYVIALIGLGVAIDYSLLVVTRWREERAGGHGRDEAVNLAMATAGKSVVFSGLTVAAGLLVLVLLPVPFLRSVGYGSMLIPLISVLASLTLLPVLLATVGPRIDWPRRRQDRASSGSRVWAWWAGGIVRHPRIAAAAALALLAPLVVAALGIRIGEPPAAVLPGTGPARDALVALESSGLPSGVLTPIEILVPAGTDPDQVAASAATVDGVHAVATPGGQAWQRDGTSLITVLPTDETGTRAGQATVQRVRDTLAAAAPAALVAGTGVLEVDGEDAIYRLFPLMLVVISLVTFVVLARAFRSLLLPLKAVVLNLLSIGAAYGVLVLVWQDGHGSSQIWGIAALNSITVWVPLMTFAFLYGLSMDYEVFLLSRMREVYDETGSTRTAVVEGLGRVGRLVTAAALILFLAFVSLSGVGQVDVKVMATAFGAGILLDATILRALLLPATVVLFGRWNWWLPGWAARLLRVPPSPVTRSTDTPPATEMATGSDRVSTR